MDITALQIFKAVVDAGGVNKAAARLHRVPSNVTTRVKQLEEQLGTKLFERAGRKLTLSASGKVLLTYANQLLRLASEAEAAVRNGKPQGTLRIGALESTSAARLPPILSKFHLLYPDVSIELVTGTSGALVASLHEGDIEAAFVAEPFNAIGVESQLAFVEEIVLITPKSHARVRSAKDIENLTVIAFANGCSYRRRLEVWLQGAKIHPERVMEFQSYHAIVVCVAAGSGIAVVPRSVLDMTSAGKEVNVIGLPADVAKAKTQLIWRPSHQSAALEALKQLISPAALRRVA